MDSIQKHLPMGDRSVSGTEDVAHIMRIHVSTDRKIASIDRGVTSLRLLRGLAMHFIGSLRERRNQHCKAYRRQLKQFPPQEFVATTRHHGHLQVQGR